MSTDEFGVNQTLIKQLGVLGFGVIYTPPKDGKKRHVKMTGTLASCLRMMEHRKSLFTPKNPNWFRDHVELDTKEGESLIGFKGGSYGDLCDSLAGRIDMEPFHVARKKLEESGLLSKLQTEIQAIMPRRKRTMSEHDGEWQYDRRWEIAPFAATTKVMAPARVIEIEAGFSISAWTGSEAIDKYGAMAWAISDLIEAAGIQTKIVWFDRIHNADSGGTINGEFHLELKKAGQYMAPSLLAAAFKANFFRRIGFGGIAVMAEVGNRTQHSGLGQPAQEKAPIRYETGKIIISPDAPEVDPTTIQKVIMDAIRAGKPATQKAG